jgi:hypothetical protein
VSSGICLTNKQTVRCVTCEVNPPKNFGLVRLQEEETRESHEVYLSRITKFPDTISQIVVCN